MSRQTYIDQLYIYNKDNKLLDNYITNKSIIDDIKKTNSSYIDSTYNIYGIRSTIPLPRYQPYKQEFIKLSASPSWLKRDQKVVYGSPISESEFYIFKDNISQCDIINGQTFPWSTIREDAKDDDISRIGFSPLWTNDLSKCYFSFKKIGSNIYYLQTETNNEVPTASKHNGVINNSTVLLFDVWGGGGGGGGPYDGTTIDVGGGGGGGGASWCRFLIDFNALGNNSLFISIGTSADGGGYGSNGDIGISSAISFNVGMKPLTWPIPSATTTVDFNSTDGVWILGGGSSGEAGKLKAKSEASGGYGGVTYYGTYAKKESIFKPLSSDIASDTSNFDPGWRGLNRCMYILQYRHGKNGGHGGSRESYASDGDTIGSPYSILEPTGDPEVEIGGKKGSDLRKTYTRGRSGYSSYRGGGGGASAIGTGGDSGGEVSESSGISARRGTGGGGGGYTGGTGGTKFRGQRGGAGGIFVWYPIDITHPHY